MSDGSAVLPEIPADVPRPAVQAPRVVDFCEWPGCSEPALCSSGNLGSKLVCSEHFKITNGTGIEEVRRAPLADAEFLVLRSPGPLSREQIDRLRDQVRNGLKIDVPVMVLDGGLELDVIRSGGWVYTYERERPPAPGRYEVALAFKNHQDIDLADWTGSGWLMADGSGDPFGYENEPPYAYRPAPVPPPVRRSGGDAR